MAYDLDSSRSELVRLHNPWEKFIQRDETKHHGDAARLNPTQAQTSTVIHQFMTHDSNQLDIPIPRKQQTLRDFLNESIIKAARGQNRTVENDVDDASLSTDIVLLDDRQKHPTCAKNYGKQCRECNIYSKNLTIPLLFCRLKEDRIRLKAEKRIIFIPNLKPAAALALIATVARRTANPLRGFMHRYLVREHHFSVSTDWGYFLEFHLPYHAMRRGPPIRDHRNIRQKPLRTTEPLPLREWSTDEEELHFYEAQTSSLSLGPDEWFWTEYFLVDTYFGSEQKLHEYIANYPSGDGFDPPLGGRGTMNPPCFDPREYWLFKVDRRVHQVTVEYTSLIETFNKRMEEYARHIRQVFQDDPSRTHTETLSNVIETVQIFVDCISAIIDAWDTFYRNQISFFTTFARDKPTWPRIIDSIIRSMAELDRLRKLLLTKRDRFRFKFDSLHTVSSLSQTETAISQGNNIKTLTQMTVYVAFPLLFTTALFGMEFLKPRYPWIFFFAVLLPTSLANYVIASDRSLSHVFRDSQRWLQARH